MRTPDVVLEVAYTTDVRPGKLPGYEAWGAPELWKLVPEGARRRRPEATTIGRIRGTQRSGTACGSNA